MAGIYIHIPFCRQACHYCSFHFSTSLKNKGTLVLAIQEELKLKQQLFADREIHSLYFGGGTPSLLTPEELTAIMTSVRKNYSLTRDAEITLEANPEDVSTQKLSAWSKLGINRLSIGIQSFSDKDLKFMNRAHNAAQSHEALRMINESEIHSVTADLMFGLIDGNLEDWKSNLDKIASYKLTHLSIYNLTIEEQTVFANWKLKNKLNEPLPQEQEEQFYYTSRYLSSLGYDHYEISNYAIPGNYAMHNTNYWKRIPYLGIGPSAHSFDGNKRSWNVSNNANYIKQYNSGSYQQNTELLDQSDHYNELVMLGLRTKWGINLHLIKKLHVGIQQHFERLSIPLVQSGILKITNDYATLTHSKWYLSDQIASDLFYIKEVETT